MKLPNDVASCVGVGYEEDDGSMGWREGCETCLRRTADYPLDVPMRLIAPPPIIAFECEFLIEPDSRA